jgi:hypothetical protein
LREAKTVMLFSASMVNAVILSFRDCPARYPVVDDIHCSVKEDKQEHSEKVSKYSGSTVS